MISGITTFSIHGFTYVAAVTKRAWPGSVSYTFFATLLVIHFSYLLCAWPRCLSHTSRYIVRGTLFVLGCKRWPRCCSPTLSFKILLLQDHFYRSCRDHSPLFRYIARYIPSYSFTWWYISDGSINEMTLLIVSQPLYCCYIPEPFRLLIFLLTDLIRLRRSQCLCHGSLLYFSPHIYFAFVPDYHISGANISPLMVVPSHTAICSLPHPVDYPFHRLLRPSRANCSSCAKPLNL